MSVATEAIETEDDYYLDYSRLSNSMLGDLKKSVKKFHAIYVARTMQPQKATPAMSLGHAVHCLVLEPMAFESRYAVIPNGIDRRTKEGKQQWAIFQDYAKGKTIIEQDDVYKAKQCAKALLKHDQLGLLFGKNAIIEQRIDFVSNGVDMRSKQDWVSLDHKLIIDVKTSSDASPEGFARSMAEYGYARQASLYRDAVAYKYGVECRFLFAVVCTAEPYEVACYEPNEAALAIGGEEASELLNQYKIRRELNNWLPAWSSGVVPIGLPRWYKHESFEVE